MCVYPTKKNIHAKSHIIYGIAAHQDKAGTLHYCWTQLERLGKMERWRRTSARWFGTKMQSMSVLMFLYANSIRHITRRWFGLGLVLPFYPTTAENKKKTTKTTNDYCDSNIMRHPLMRWHRSEWLSTCGGQSAGCVPSCRALLYGKVSQVWLSLACLVVSSWLCCAWQTHWNRKRALQKTDTTTQPPCARNHHHASNDESLFSLKHESSKNDAQTHSHTWPRVFGRLSRPSNKPETRLVLQMRFVVVVVPVSVLF